jgi:ubiquinone/menaquinone biosynthesis C-methylase UbiE
MSQLSNQEYLLTSQYKDASKLNARVQLHVRFSTNKYGWQRWVFDQLQLAPGSRVLELGCGPGYLWLENLDRVAGSWDITLSDFSPGMLETARQNLSQDRVRFKFELFDAQSIPFDGESFDVVVANQMLYHIPDRSKAFSEIRRVLKPGGRFFAATNGQAHLRELGELVHSFVSETPSETENLFAGMLSFSLENGYEQLAAWFADVSLRRYEDSLAVTEAAPLADYILSTSKAASIALDRQAFTSFIEQRLVLEGVVRITKDAGIFVATRPKG